MEMPGPACKYLATTVRTPINFQPVFNFAKTEHRPRIAPSRTTLPFQPVQTLSTREHPPGEKLVVPTKKEEYGFVCHLYSVRTLSSRRIVANNCNFHPPNRGGKLRVEFEL